MEQDVSKEDIIYISVLIFIVLCIVLIEPFQFSILIGDSMEPTISEGSVIIYTKHSEITEGDIIVFEQKDILIGHRVVDIKDDKFITKGDNNQKRDEPVEKSEVEGKIIYTADL